MQPLDLKIFGALKATAKQQICQLLTENPQDKIGLKKAVEILIYSWERLTSALIEDSWDVYEE